MNRTWIPVTLLLAACGGSGEVVEPVATAPTPEAQPSELAPSIYDDPVPEGASESDPQEDGFSLAMSNIEPEPIASIKAPAPEHVFDIEVKPGESMVLLARWSGIPAEDIAALNAVHVASTVFPGQDLILPLDADGASQFEADRTDFHDSRMQRFVDGRGGLVKVHAHQVGTGETAWGIARSGDMPLWVLSWFNQDADLDRLSIGDELYLPVLGDSIATAASDFPPEDASAVVSAGEPEIGVGGESTPEDMVATAEE